MARASDRRRAAVTEQPTELVGLIRGAIDRESPVPFYFQLALLLERAVRVGQLRNGDRLPSEPDMCLGFGLSRTTVRQALSWLEAQGLISRRRGEGTFVRGTPSHAWHLSSSGGLFEEEVIRMGHEVVSHVLRAERGSLPAWAVEALRLPEGAEGATIERVRVLDGRPAIYVVNHVVPEYAEAALDISDPNESLYLRLAARTGVHATGGSRTLRALIAGDDLAGLLGLEARHPVLFIESISWDGSRRPFDCYRAWVVSEVLPIEISAVSVPSDVDV